MVFPVPVSGDGASPGPQCRVPVHGDTLTKVTKSERCSFGRFVEGHKRLPRKNSGMTQVYSTLPTVIHYKSERSKGS